MSPSSISDSLRLHGLKPKKKWGQCFLHDPKIIARIVSAAALEPEDVVVEIGAGLGNLTKALAGAAKQIIAIERDRDLIPLLYETFPPNQSSVEIHEANALTFDLTNLRHKHPQGRMIVVGNLPYQISSPLLFRILSFAPILHSATLMFQREVALRLVAAPSTSAYGAPSVLCQNIAAAALCFEVKRGAFLPSPNVDSAIVRLVMHAPPLKPQLSYELFHQVVHAAFQQRRKTLRNALSKCFPLATVDAALADAVLDGRRRGETLNVEEFQTLTMSLHQNRSLPAFQR